LNSDDISACGRCAASRHGGHKGRVYGTGNAHCLSEFCITPLSTDKNTRRTCDVQCRWLVSVGGHRCFGARGIAAVAILAGIETGRCRPTPRRLAAQAIVTGAQPTGPVEDAVSCADRAGLMTVVGWRRVRVINEAQIDAVLAKTHVRIRCRTEAIIEAGGCNRRCHCSFRWYGTAVTCSSFVGSCK